jgi:hypothetical protein
VAEWIVLIEEVIFALEVDEPVGIVEPAARREMKLVAGASPDRDFPHP